MTSVQDQILANLKQQEAIQDHVRRLAAQNASKVAVLASQAAHRAAWYDWALVGFAIFLGAVVVVTLVVLTVQAWRMDHPPSDDEQFDDAVRAEVYRRRNVVVHRMAVAAKERELLDTPPEEWVREAERSFDSDPETEESPHR